MFIYINFFLVLFHVYFLCIFLFCCDGISGRQDPVVVTFPLFKRHLVIYHLSIYPYIRKYKPCNYFVRIFR